MKILITGASKGIGLQIAKELAERGYELVLHCNSTEKALLDFVDENKNKNLFLFLFDVASPKSTFWWAVSIAFVAHLPRAPPQLLVFV